MPVDWVVVGLDNGGTTNNGTILDSSGRFLLDRMAEVPSNVRKGPDKAIQSLVDSVEQVLGLTGVPMTSVRAVGLDTPGPASGDGVISSKGATNFGHVGWRGFDIRGALAERLGLPVIYNNDEPFPIGGAKVLRESPADKVTVVAAGVTLFEALKAADALKNAGIGITVIDAYSIKPLAKDVIKAAAQKTDNLVVTVEDHYAEGGLGDAVAGELSAEGMRVHKLAVYELPHSGKPEELLAKYGIDAEAIVTKVKSLAR